MGKILFLAQTLFKPLKSLGKSLIRISIWANSHLLKTIFLKGTTLGLVYIPSAIFMDSAIAITVAILQNTIFCDVSDKWL